MDSWKLIISFQSLQEGDEHIVWELRHELQELLEQKSVVRNLKFELEKTTKIGHERRHRQ